MMVGMVVLDEGIYKLQMRDGENWELLKLHKRNPMKILIDPIYSMQERKGRR